MTPYLGILLIVYLAGAGAFLLFWRDMCYGGWAQVLVTALVWPAVLGAVLYAFVFKKDQT